MKYVECTQDTTGASRTSIRDMSVLQVLSAREQFVGKSKMSLDLGAVRNLPRVAPWHQHAAGMA